MIGETLRHGMKNFSFLSWTYVYLTLMQHLKGFSAKCLCENWLAKLIEWRHLTHLLRVKVEGSTVKEFQANHKSKAMSLWHNDGRCRMHQPQRKAYREREGERERERERKRKQTEIKSLNFNLTSIF